MSRSRRGAGVDGGAGDGPVLDGLFLLSGKVAGVTGATVVFGGAMARAI